jgi:hypothetical protein
VDPEGDRTIGVLTKPDLINPGAEDEVSHITLPWKEDQTLASIHVRSSCEPHQMIQYPSIMVEVVPLGNASPSQIHLACYLTLFFLVCLLQVLSVMKNVRKPLKLGYVMVKNRTQVQLNMHQSLAEAQAQEIAFLRAHPAFAALPDAQLVRLCITYHGKDLKEEFENDWTTIDDGYGKSRVTPVQPTDRPLPVGMRGLQGVGSLAARLTRVLVSRIHACLPFMKHELGEKLRATGRQVEALGEPGPIEAGQCRSAVMHIITRYAPFCRVLIDRSSRGLSMVGWVREEEGRRIV